MDQQLKGQQLMEVVERASMKKADDVPQFEIGDTVDVHTRILEGEKERCCADELPEPLRNCTLIL